MSAEDRLDAVLQRAARDRQLTGIVAMLHQPGTGLVWAGSHGDCTDVTEFFVASTTKLHTNAIVLRMVDRGALSLDDRIVEILGRDRTAALHVRRGVDRTHEITIRHLLSQTSGLADYLSGRPPNGPSLEAQLRSGRDRSWTADEALGLARRVGAVFAPGAPRKALYSDTNHQLLGLVIEQVCGVPYATALRREVIEPLGLGRTRLYVDPTDDSPLPLRDGDHVLAIPRAMASFGPDGGVVSTAGDLMVLVRAFFEGELFDPGLVPQLGVYRRIFFPMQYGVGIMRFWAPPLLGGAELVGHSGLSGAFAFLSPASRTYVTGTVNNLARPSRSYQLVLRLLGAANSRRR